MKPEHLYRVARSEDGLRLLSFLAMRLRLSHNRAKALLDTRAVFVNGFRVWMARHSLRAGDVVVVNTPESLRRDRTIPVRFRDARYVVADKPPGLVSVNGTSVESLLRAQLHASWLRAVHRLDRDTSGCLLLALDTEALARAQDLFRERRVVKVYHAIVTGRLTGGERTIRVPLDGERAETRLRVLDAGKRASHLAVRIDTGRTHQIRRHLLSLGHPVLGEKCYGQGVALPPAWQRVSRHMLHARVLEFPHPFTGQWIRVQAPLPADFCACLRRFRLT